MSSTDPEEDPAEVCNVYITHAHVIETFAGTFEVYIYDPLGRELAHAPLVPDAKDWADALAKLWPVIRETVVKNNAISFN